MPAPFYVGVFCDHGACEADERGDYLANDRDHAFACLRRDLETVGWLCDKTGDWCPEHNPVCDNCSDHIRLCDCDES